MTSYDYLIVGGGMIADNAAKAIRATDPVGTIGILSEDVDPPYTRPALSKKLWTDPEFTEDAVPLGTEETGADIRLATTVTSIDPAAKTVSVGDEVVGFGSLLLATGGHPTRIPGLDPSASVVYFRSFADYRQLRNIADRHGRLAVVGGGYIGTELAAALVQAGCEVTIVTPDEVLGGSVFPATLAQAFHKLFVDAGVTVLTGRVESGSPTEGGVLLSLEGDSRLEAEAVVVGLGIDPATELAQAAGIEVDDGIVVDAGLRTSTPLVFAAGDVASYPDAILGRRRVEHVDNANEMGTAVGRIMAGSDEEYRHTPYYYSAVFGQRYEAVGTLDSSLTTVEDWAEPQKAGVVYYLDDTRVMGVLLWNVSDDDHPEKRDAARAVLASSAPATPESLIGRI